MSRQSFSVKTMLSDVVVIVVDVAVVVVAVTFAAVVVVAVTVASANFLLLYEFAKIVSRKKIGDDTFCSNVLLRSNKGRYYFKQRNFEKLFFCKNNNAILHDTIY